MRAYFKEIEDVILSICNVVISAIFGGVTLIGFILSYCMSNESLHTFTSIMQTVGTILLITGIPSIVATSFITLKHIAWQCESRKDPRILLEEARLRLEAEKVLIEVEHMAHERRMLADQNLSEQIHRADAAIQLLDDKGGTKRQRVSIN